MERYETVRLDWCRQQIERRELQNRTFKRDRDEITMTIGDARFLLDMATHCNQLLEGVRGLANDDPLRYAWLADFCEEVKAK